MGLPTITRKVGWREDALNAALWLTNQTANVAASNAGDGDQVTLTDVFTSAVAGNYGEQYQGSVGLPLPATATSTYPFLLVRHKDSGLGANPDPYVQLTYTDNSLDAFLMTKSTSYIVEQFNLTAGKTLREIHVYLKANANLSGTFSLTYDFSFMFGELLTLPSITQPIQERDMQNIAEVPILQRVGGQQQHLGAFSPEYTVAGRLVTTTSPNNYTASQWWQILKGLGIESSTVQADGNPTWQWFTSGNEIAAKVLVRGVMPQKPMGVLQNFPYALMLKQFDVLAETTSQLVGVTY